MCPTIKNFIWPFFSFHLIGRFVSGGLQTTENVFCPFNGRYQFIYKTERKQISCDGSELSNCPHGNALGKFLIKNFYMNKNVQLLVQQVVLTIGSSPNDLEKIYQLD